MISLQVEDTRDAKFGLALELSKRLDLLPPIYIISHRRARRLRTLQTLPALTERARLVVAAEEAEEYRRAHPRARVLTIPKGYRGLEIGVGRAKQFVFDTADLLGQDHILIIDDDLKNLSVLYAIGAGKVSHAFLQAIGNRQEELQLGLLVLMALCAGEAYAAHDNAVTASPQGNNSNRTTGSSEVRWELNRGGVPSQLQSWRVDRFRDRCRELDLLNFNRHGDDIAAACLIVSAGGAVVNVPSIIGSYFDYETQSVLRDPRTAPGLRQEEHDGLMKLPLARYVKTRTDVLDRPQWHSLNWTALERDGRTTTARTLWTDA